MNMKEKIRADDFRFHDPLDNLTVCLNSNDRNFAKSAGIKMNHSNYFCRSSRSGFDPDHPEILELNGIEEPIEITVASWKKW